MLRVGPHLKPVRAETITKPFRASFSWLVENAVQYLSSPESYDFSARNGVGPGLRFFRIPSDFGLPPDDLKDAKTTEFDLATILERLLDGREQVLNMKPGAVYRAT